MRRIGRFARKHGYWVLLSALALSVPCLFAVRRLGLETNLVNMFPAGEPAIEDFRYFSENFGVSDALVLVVRGERAERSRHVNALARWLKSSQDFTWVDVQRLPRGEPLTVLLAFPRESSMNQPFCLGMAG